MGTLLLTGCPYCGDIQVQPNRVRLFTFNDSSLNNYAFTCPGCGDNVTWLAPPEYVKLLISAGIPPEYTHIPMEVREPKNGPLITIDDVLDFALVLEGVNPDLIAYLAQSNVTTLDLS